MAKKHSEPYRLYKRPNRPYWYAYISFPCKNGTRKSLRISTGLLEKEGAAQFCLNFISKYWDKVKDDQIRMTIDEAFYKHYTSTGQYQSRPDLIYGRLKILKTYFTEHNVKYLDEITDPLLNTLVDDFHKTRKEGTINRFLSLLSAIIKNAHYEWHVAYPDVNISSKKLKEPDENVYYLKDEEHLQKIIDRAAPHLKPIIEAGMYTTFREGTLLNLKWLDVDLINKQITTLVKNNTKKGGKYQSAPIIPKLFNLLSKLPRVSDYVFTYNGKHIKSIYTAWNSIFYKRCNGKFIREERFLKDKDLPYVTFTTLRHTCATWTLKKVRNLKTVQKLMGHSSIRTTLKYAHILNDDVKDALEETFE